MEPETAAAPARSGLTPLCELAQKYGTDKLGIYTPFYDLILGPRRSDVKHVLEVGIGTPESMRHVANYKPGASLRMWRDYFPNASISGLDINPNASNDAADPENRISTYAGDSRGPVRQILIGPFDLILDDGDHAPPIQLATFQSLSPLLALGGLYIIEDTEFFSELTGHLPEHTLIRHMSKSGLGLAILIRQEALNG